MIKLVVSLCELVKIDVSARKVKRNYLTIGVLAGWQAYAGMLDSFLDHVLRGIQAGARDRECNLMLACGVGSARGVAYGRPAWPIISPEVDFIPVGPWNSDGLIVAPPLASTVWGGYFEALLGQGYPLVYAGDRETGPAVVVDNTGGIHQALSHLYDHGHRRIAFVAGDRQRVQGDSGIRLRAYMTGIQALGLDYAPELIVYGRHTFVGGRQAAEQLLAKGGHFTAILASNDESAIGVMDALRDAGKLVPHDIAVIGFDDRFESRAQIPLLTTVRYPMFEVGYQSVGLLLKSIQGCIEEGELVSIPTQLVIRESCGCLPGISSSPKDRNNKEQRIAPTASRRFHPSLSPGGSLQSGLISPAIAIEKPEADIITALATAAYNESQLLSFAEIEYLCHSLLEAFKISLVQGDLETFRQSVLLILERISNRGDDLYAWQRVISVLRENTPALLASTSSDLTGNQVEDMLHQARMAVSEVSRGRSSRLLIQQKNIADQIGWLTTRLFSAQDQDELFEILTRELPELGIKHVSVAFYDADDEDPVAWSVLQTPALMDSRLHEAHLRFPTREFPPQGLYPESEPFNLVMLPLIEKGANFGFAAFEASNLDQSAFIVRQLVAALRGIHLYQEAVEARQAAEAGQKIAEETNRLKSRFLSMVSHELRTPLNLISGLSDIILRQSEPIGSRNRKVNKKDLERIYTSAQYLDGLIRDVLDLASSDAGQLRLTCEPLQIQEVLEAVAVIGEQMAHDKGLKWRVEFTEPLPLVWGDRTRLRQVTLNLVNNAIKFTAFGGVNLSASAQEGQVTVSVSDTGLGIPTKEQRVIFNEFQQSERSAARGYGGLGLGLAICKRLVEMHGGEIFVSSSGEEGKGSKFTFTLPTFEYANIPANARLSLDQAQHVLLLVKDIEGGEILQDHLVAQGYAVEVYAASTGSDWLARLMLASPDMVVLDLGFTSERGWEILKILKENPATKNIPVLFYTLARDEDCGSLLALDYLTKPLGTSALAEALVSQGLLNKENDDGSEKKILIVDDEPGILELHSRILNDQLPEYRIYVAQNGREALEIIRQERPALVLLDLMMPEMDGFAVLEAMRKDELSRNIPVVVVTGQALNNDDMARLNCGVASVLGKGMFSVEETLEHVSAALAHRKKPGSEAQRMVLKAMAYIHAHFAEPISRHDVAAHVGLSERHLTRCFNREVGMTPITYLNRYRVRQAKNLLETTAKGITEVALEVGFSNSGYFTRVFREEVGVSPRAYLQTKKNGH
jgi:signal transduction histidine kinase/CheY-like chemotaxis protein